MIRKTVKVKRHNAKTWSGSTFKNMKHTEDVLTETWWFLFVPIYSRNTIIKSNM